jgi:hypothetical protein
VLLTTRRNKFKPDFEAKVALEVLKGDEPWTTNVSTRS